MQKDPSINCLQNKGLSQRAALAFMPSHRTLIATETTLEPPKWIQHKSKDATWDKLLSLLW